MLDSRNDLWAIVLAGGEGDSQTLLRHTLDRVARLIPPSRTIAVTRASHAAHVAGELGRGPGVPALLHDRLTRFELFTGTRYETGALQQAYLFAPTADFSRTVLASADIPLAVVEIPAQTWRDLGTPERVARDE